MKNNECDFEKEIEVLFPTSKKEKKFGVLLYGDSENAIYNSDYCHFTVSLPPKNVKNLSIFSFCLGYVIDRNQLFHSFNEYQGNFKISIEDEKFYLINSDLKISTFDHILPGNGIGSIYKDKNCIQVFYKENFSDQLFSLWDYKFQMEYLSHESLLHVYDQRKRKRLETFLLEGRKDLNDVAFCNLENKSLKKIFGDNRNDDNELRK